MRTLKVNQNIKVAGHKTKTKSWKMLKHTLELRGTAESGDLSDPFNIQAVMWFIVNVKI